MELLNGQTLGDYVVLKEIGHGGVGRVYEVEHTITRRREAVKTVSFEGAGATEKSERFLREIRLQAALSHPNIASVHNAFWTDDHFVLVTELLEGEPLQAVIDRGRLRVDRAIEIIRQVLAALRCAHSRGIMHRDISPANIFVTSAGPTKLIDFGLAKAPTDLNRTQAGLAVGSFYYTSPEQIRAEATVDIRTDLYSCGVVLYEMLTGRKPFEGTAFEVMQAHCELAPQDPHLVEPSIPEAVSEVVMTALAKNADDRFGSAEDFLRGLEEITVTTAEPTKKNRVAPWVLVGSFVLAGGLGFVIARAGPRAIASPAVEPKLDAPVLAPSVAAPAHVAEPVRPDPKPLVVKAPDLVPTAEPEPGDQETVVEQAPEPQDQQRSQAHGVLGAVKKLNPFHKHKNQQSPPIE